jgi:O-methyltransferase
VTQSENPAPENSLSPSGEQNSHPARFSGLHQLKAEIQHSSRIERLRRYHRLYSTMFLLSIPPREFVEHPDIIRAIYPVKSSTMLPYPRLRNLFELVRTLDEGGVRGAIVQLGVWRGGSSAVMVRALTGRIPRAVWLFDSWEGTASPQACDVSTRGQVGRRGLFAAPEESARALLGHESVGRAAELHFVRGWFDTTLAPALPSVGPIALLHVDCDFYDSVKLCLEIAYPQVVPGGFVVIDDYGAWKGCRKAVDQFLSSARGSLSLSSVDDSAVYFRRPPVSTG